MNTRDENTGELIFRVLKVGLACQSCQDLGLSAECTHMEQVSNVSLCLLVILVLLTSLFLSLVLVPSALEIRGQIQRREAHLRSEQGYVRARVARNGHGRQRSRVPSASRH